MPSSPLKDVNAKVACKTWIEKSIGIFRSEAMRHWHHQEELTDFFFRTISGRITTSAGEITVSSFKPESPPPTSLTKRIGANGILLVSVKTEKTNLEGFCIFSTKKAEKIADKLTGSTKECALMLERTAASYLITILRKDVNAAGAMAVLSSMTKDPALEDIPYVSFKRYLVDQLFHGIMLEPILNLEKVIDKESILEIRHVITINALGNDVQIQEGKQTEKFLSKLGLEIRRL